jgi:hypothetical protein
MSLRISSRQFVPFVIICAAVAILPTRALAFDVPQQPVGGSSVEPAPPDPDPQIVAVDDDDAVLDPLEPDFVVVNLPTTLRLPLHKGYFRLTHRFAGNLRNGTFGQLAGNLFGIDQGAIIGFEYRYAIARHVELAAYRSSFDRTIQIYGKYDAIHQSKAMPISLSALVSEEGTNNYRDKFAPALGVVLSREVAGRIALYVAPMWVHNSAASLDDIGHQHGIEEEGPQHKAETHDTTYVGLGGRLLILPTLTIVGEVTPRTSGYAPDDAEYGFGLEKRVGGHVFSLTFTNTFGTTAAQLARGGGANTLYLGFNLSRKFF